MVPGEGENPIELDDGDLPTEPSAIEAYEAGLTTTESALEHGSPDEEED